MTSTNTQIYFDNASTSLPDALVLQRMNECAIEFFANSASTHKIGVKCATLLEKCRMNLANTIGAEPDEIYFTSGGTESNNWVLQTQPEGSHIITSSIEHPSILEPLRWLEEKRGAEVTYLGVDQDGFINLEELDSAFKPNTQLVSIMHANNEIGTIQNIEAISRICRQHNTPFHTDACQSLGREPLDVKKIGLTMATLNAHKIHGPKGVGALFCKKDFLLQPLLIGGGQERDFRSGTVNLPAIFGFVEALTLAAKQNSRAIELNLRNYFREKLTAAFPQVKINGSMHSRLSSNLNFRIPGVDGKKLYNELNQRNVFVSLGSACSATQKTASHVLLAIGLDETQAFESLRISLSRQNNESEIDHFLLKLKEITG